MKNASTKSTRQLKNALLMVTSIVCVMLMMSCTNQSLKDVKKTITPPVGLWVWEQKIPPSEIQLTITLREGNWIAKVNSIPVNLVKSGESFTLEGPNEQTFSASFSQNRQMISGYWKQATNELGYSTMVTKVELKRGQTESWSGAFYEQPRPFHIFLDIFEGENNDYHGVIRNPERNEIMRASKFQVKPEAKNHWFLLANRGDSEIKIPLIKITEQSLQISHSRFSQPITLVPAGDKEKAHYYPRHKSAAEQHYRVPQILNDGWEVASAKQTGLDSSALTRLINHLVRVNPRDSRPDLIHSMLIAHKGRLVFEEYFFGHDVNAVHDTRSLAKVFGSVMLGAMNMHKMQVDPHVTPLEDILRKQGKNLNDSEKRKVTLAHLLTYSSGLDCNIASRASLGEEDNMWNQHEEPNFWIYTAQLPLLHPPGHRYAYCSGSSNLVGSVIGEKMKMPIYEAFHNLIASPLQFAPYHWNLMPNDEGYLGGGVYMRPRDILKIGAVYASGGKWNGKHIVSPEWIEESTTTKIAISPKTTGLSEQEFANNYFGGGQAYIWRTDTVKTPDGEYKSYEATGNGGQILLVIPELELSVVFTGGNYFMGSIWGKWRDDLVGTYVVPEVVAQGKG